MFSQTFINVSDNFTVLWIDDDLLVAVVLSINLALKMIPLTRISVEIFARDTFIDYWIFATCSFVFYLGFLIKRYRVSNRTADGPCRGTANGTWCAHLIRRALQFFDAHPALRAGRVVIVQNNLPHLFYRQM